MPAHPPVSKERLLLGIDAQQASFEAFRRVQIPREGIEQGRFPPVHHTTPSGLFGLQNIEFTSFGYVIEVRQNDVGNQS
jgi:hypothetical protein